MEEIQEQHNIIINHILLIYKRYEYLSRNSESLDCISLKNYILQKKNLEKKQLKMIRIKRATFLKMAGY